MVSVYRLDLKSQAVNSERAMHPTTCKIWRWLVLASGLFAVFLFVAGILSGSMYYYAFRSGALDTVGTTIQHPDLVNKLGPIRTYRLFFWSIKLSRREDQTTIHMRVFISGETANGSANVRLRRENGGAWRPYSLDLLTKGKSSSVSEVEKWYDNLLNYGKDHKPPVRRFPVPFSPGIVSTTIVASIMSAWLLLIAGYVQWMKKRTARMR